MNYYEKMANKIGKLAMPFFKEMHGISTSEYCV